jgi:serine/threonine protein kinase
MPGYRVLEPLGWGTLGRVYAAESEFDGSQLALKVLHEDLARDSLLRTRFLEAATRAADVEHPNLVRIIAASDGAEGQAPHLVMERCIGCSIVDYLHAPLLPFELVCQVGIGICQGLAAAHAAGLVHGDLKPAHVIVAWDRAEPPSVKLLDVGMSARVFGNDDNLRWAAGTPRYMAPEVMLGREADERSDVYSAAALLYEMLGGVPVIDTDDDLEALKAAVKGHWRPLTDHNPVLPEALVRAVESGLHTDPKKRLGSPQELLRQLLPFSALSASGARRLMGVDGGEPSNIPASTRLNQAPRPRSSATLPMRDLASPVFPKSPAAPNIDPTGGATDAGVESIEDELSLAPSAPPEARGLPVDLIVLGAGFGVGCMLVWWTI